MANFYCRKDSKYYWIRVYDKLENLSSKKRKRINSKIPLSETDRKRIDQWVRSGAKVEDKPKLAGNEKIKRLVASINAGMFESELQEKLKIQIRIDKTLSEGLNEYINSKVRFGDKKSLKRKTILAYKTAIDRFIEATGIDVEIYKYSESDFSKFLAFMEANNYSDATRNNYTNHLKILWNFFIKQKYTAKNIIEVYQGSKTLKPEDIPLNEFKIILDYYKDKPEKYEWVYYLLLTMNRPSTALMQERDRINFNQKYIEMINVKETRKKSKYYIYPLFKELEELIERIMQRPIIDGSNRLFSHFKISKNNYTDSLSWWYKDMRRLHQLGLISKPYQMKQIRKTLPSYAINELGFSVEEVKVLLDHTSVEVTTNYYLNIRYDKIRERFEQKRLF